MIATVGSAPYNVVLVLHLLAVLAAFAPVFVHPFFTQDAPSMAPEQRRQLFGLMAGYGRRVQISALLLAGLFGFALSGMSGGVYGLAKPWLLASIVVWVAMNGVSHAVILRGEKAVAAGDDSGQRQVALGGAVLSIMLLVMLGLMVFKPGQ